MLELPRYFPAILLDLTWELESQLDVQRTHDGHHKVTVMGKGPLAFKLINNSEFPERETSSTLIMYKSLGLFQKKGPVIVRPGLNLCQALLDTEIRLPTSEFRMPYPIMGIELPEAIVKPHWPSLTIVWKMFPDTVLVWTMSPNTICYHNLLGDDLPTMEDRLIRAEACDDETEYNLMVLGSRIALNLCMLATFRLTELTTLPLRVQRHRRLRDQRLNRLAARHCQEILFKDLVIRDRPHQDYQPGTGDRLAAQHRRGHWKRVAYGEKFSQRKWSWINDYWTHVDEIEPGRKPPTIILK
jgi:hypothetical protein